MKKDFPLVEKLSDYEQKRLNELKDVPNAYIPAFVTNVDNYKVPVEEFIHPKFKVYHDETLRGDGTIEYPLSVVCSGGSGSSGSSGGSGCNCQPYHISSPNNTIIVNHPTQYDYNLEGTNWGYRYAVTWDETAPVDTIPDVDGSIETEIIYEEGDPALKFVMQNTDNKVVTKINVLTAANDYRGYEIASFTGDFTYNFDPLLFGKYYSIDVESKKIAGSAPYKIDVYSGTAIKGDKPEELVFKSDYDLLLARVERLEQYLPTADSDLMFNNKPVMFNNKPLTYTE